MSNTLWLKNITLIGFTPQLYILNLALAHLNKTIEKILTTVALSR